MYKVSIFEMEDCSECDGYVGAVWFERLEVAQDFADKFKVTRWATIEEGDPVG